MLRGYDSSNVIAANFCTLGELKQAVSTHLVCLFCSEISNVGGQIDFQRGSIFFLGEGGNRAGEHLMESTLRRSWTPLGSQGPLPAVLAWHIISPHLMVSGVSSIRRSDEHPYFKYMWFVTPTMPAYTGGKCCQRNNKTIRGRDSSNLAIPGLTPERGSQCETLWRVLHSRTVVLPQTGFCIIPTTHKYIPIIEKYTFLVTGLIALKRLIVQIKVNCKITWLATSSVLAQEQ